ncbi:hypothetical protein GCM10022219_17090 [Microbacterium oryzae]|uniref:IclR family transcriptional regulator n=1 Tax=Microbacterium oryzae TaxID=743009 RepID=A0A6I6DSR5_9MICO|nr:IclR family transcriptional regulator [Microbacterium oryzae]QGU27992.1 IclR family transcriptional regulator [Microbacterium oryzae]
MTSDTAARPGLEIIDKADAVLRVLTAENDLSAAEIAAAVGEPTSSTYRLLTSLAAVDLIESAPARGRFRLSVDLMRIGGAVEDRLSVREAAVPGLRRLLADTGLTSFLCIRAGDRAVCVERFDGRDVRSLALALGQSLPLHRGAAPQALFAFLPQAERMAVVASLRTDRSDPVTETDEEIERMVAAVRAAGSTLSDGDVTPGIAAVGAPVFDHRGQVAAAISVSGIRGQVLDPALDVPERVRSAARAASAQLGFREEER